LGQQNALATHLKVPPKCLTANTGGGKNGGKLHKALDFGKKTLREKGPQGGNWCGGFKKIEDRRESEKGMRQTQKKTRTRIKQFLGGTNKKFWGGPGKTTCEREDTSAKTLWWKKI